MNWLAHRKHLQSVLKKFDATVASSDNLFIQSFRNSLQSSICIYLDEKNHNLYDEQEIIKWTINAEAKTSCQAPFLVHKTDTRCFRGHWSTRTDKHKDKDSEIKKIYSFLSANQGNSRNESQLRQAFGYAKKNFRSKCKYQQSQATTISITSSNATTIKNDNNPGDNDLSQVKCYARHKKGYYANKYSIKEPKN